MRNVTRTLAVVGIAVGLLVPATAASADPILGAVGCQPGDERVVVEVLNTEIVEVCYTVPISY